MATCLRVVAPCGVDGADAEWKVGEVGVFEAECLRAKVECGQCPNAVVEVLLKLIIMGKKAVKVVHIVSIELGHPHSKGP